MIKRLNKYRKIYRYFGHLCEVPIPILENLNEYYKKLNEEDPILSDANYKQWQVQISKGEINSKLSRETCYSHWTDNSFLNPSKIFFSKFVTNIVKFRFSYLKKSSIVDYHTIHTLPRIHIPLNNANSIFFIKDDNGIEHKYNLEYGSAHFINVSHHHKVVSDQDNRINCFFSFTDFTDEKLKEQFIK